MASKEDRDKRDELVRDLAAGGWSYRDIAKEIGCSVTTVKVALDPDARARARERYHQRKAATAPPPAIRDWQVITVICHPAVGKAATVQTVTRDEFLTRMAGHPIVARHQFDTRYAVLTDPAAVQQWKRSAPPRPAKEAK